MMTTEKNLLVKLDGLIDENLDNPAFGVDLICQALGISRSQLHRVIKEQTELSTSLYIRKRRLLNARQLLMESEWRISEIADRVGMTNPQNFSTYFTEAFGVSPTEFRKLSYNQAAETSQVAEQQHVIRMDSLTEPVLLPEQKRRRPVSLRWHGLAYAVIVAALVLLVSVGLYGWQQPAVVPALPAKAQNPEALNLYLQGKQLLITRSVANLRESIVRFDRALALDSTYADAYAGKATANLLLPTSVGTDRDEQYRLAEQSALTAIRFDPTNSTAYGVLGSLYHSTYQWQASENAYKIALQHNPNDAQINYWYSLVLRSMGRVNEAFQYSSRAVALDPLHPIMLGGHILNCLYIGRFDLARASIDNGRGLFDESFSYQYADAYYHLGRAEYGEAVIDFKKALALNPDDRGHIPVILYCEAKGGNPQPALGFLKQLTATTPRANYERAVVYAGLGQTDSCLTYLKKAADGGYIYRDMIVLPVFKPYHDHPVFRGILRQYKLIEG